MHGWVAEAFVDYPPELHTIRPGTWRSIPYINSFALMVMLPGLPLIRYDKQLLYLTMESIISSLKLMSLDDPQSANDNVLY